MAKARQSKIPEDIVKMTFEKALTELESIVQKLEGGDVDLEKSIDIYERGTQLKTHCETKLAAAQAKVEKITLSADGTVSASPANIS
jgi:exodeoxyribonuclease VII small subunit